MCDMVRRVSRSGLVIGCVIAIATGACARDPIASICPPVLEGDLVISELRGAQSGADTYGQWVEIYNASPGDLDLEGLHVVFTRTDGKATSRVIVRRPLPIAAGGYVVIGRAADDQRPPRVDYGMGTDFTSAFYTTAKVELVACDVLIDDLQYTALPTMGTRALAVHPPDAAKNDADSAWCTDAEPNPDTTQLGLPGSPGAENPPCP
jgi:hypothetical protein